VLIFSEAMAVTHVRTFSSCPLSTPPPPPPPPPGSSLPGCCRSSSGSSALLLVVASGGEATEEQEAGEEEMEEDEEDRRSWWWWWWWWRTPPTSSPLPPVSGTSGSEPHSMLLSLAWGLRAEEVQEEDEEEVQVEEEEEEGWACSVWSPPMGRRGSRLRVGCWECRGRWLRRFGCRALAPHDMLGARPPL